MEPVSVEEIRRSFVNSTKSQIKAMTPPARFTELPWESLDYLGWRDAKAPNRAYLVVRRDDGLIAIALQTAATGKPRRGTGLCDICNTAHQVTDVALFVARRAGSAGREGNTVGTYICADLACSLYIRGLRELEVPQGDTASPEVRATRLGERLESFAARVLA
ncbi:treble-clef zinc-finger protein [Kribbella amoyensis]|uniref:Treble-clef zinc-finger protein n=1 Tax=Kribbella amoyensis TaxID=996641 RepID=A0A561B2K7_9ACTN|nr:FBP domain-containing protein [Kribbella amoyensis]TWD73074.1 treble-clef zinc-finger protein [Kribbella amoyensis]